MNDQHCTIETCQNFAEGFTTPPLCSLHLDLAVLVDFALARGEEATPETIQKHYQRGCQNSSHLWTLTAADIPAQLPAVLAAHQEAETANQ